jgi:hypothetical protein
MKKLFFMLFVMCSAHTFAGQEESDISLDDSTKTEKCYDKADLVMTSGATMFGTGLIYYFTASRTVGIVSMATGGTVTLVGIIMKLGNRKKNGNRGG